MCLLNHAPGDPSSPFVAGKTESKEFTPEVSLTLRKSVIDCLTEHDIDDCPPKKTGQLPRRILDVGPVGDGVIEDFPVRLKESQEGEKAIYTTLSYCWGDPQYQLTTVKANLQAHLQGLPIDERLPRTFADAIRVTRHLGIQYLWIDALCIIQDDETDKLEQIEAMSDIYRNSTVMIAASSASEVSEGFLRNCKPLKAVGKLPLLVSTSGEPEQHGLIYLRGDWVSVSVSDEPLYSRAWTFQEAVLSPRVLDFNTYKSVHMCSHLEYPSIFSGHKVVGHEWPGEDIFKNIHRLEASQFFQSLYFMHPRYMFRNGEFDRDKFGMWRDVVYEYSARRLTFPGDRLPALSGIARRLTPFAGTYVAGLWKESLVYHLGWEHQSMRDWPLGEFQADRDLFHVQNSRDGVVTSRPSPSWSWVSVPYGVFIAPLLKPDATLVECHVDTVSDQSPYGQVQQGTIMLQARIIDFSDLQFVPSVFHESDRVAFETDRSIILDFREPRFSQRGKTTRLLYLGSRSHWEEPYKVSLASKADARTFLVINKTEAGDTYRRVGTFHLKESDIMVRSGELDMILQSKQLEVVSIT
jgi:hypothetical protein